jgi:hypothetical protein
VLVVEAESMHLRYLLVALKVQILYFQQLPQLVAVSAEKVQLLVVMVVLVVVLAEMLHLGQAQVKEIHQQHLQMAATVLLHHQVKETMEVVVLVQ